MSQVPGSNHFIYEMLYENIGGDPVMLRLATKQ